jgi:mRNA-degrading endonuclease RelE of RelBE toxin-antitoxin system
MGESGPLFEFIESKIFSTQINQLGHEILLRIQSDLAKNPERGAIVEGTHGVRKARAANPAFGRGKSGGYRYLYLYLEHAGRIHLLYLFGKSEQADLSSAQKRIIGALSQEIRKESLRHGHKKSS